MPKPHSIPEPARIGALLAEYRHARGLSQEALALRAGLDRTYIGYVEQGKRNPTVQATWRVLVALGVSWREFGERLDALHRHED